MRKEVRIDTFAIDGDVLSAFPIVYPISGLCPNKNYKVLVYAGERNYTASNRLIVNNLRLEKLTAR